MRVNWETAEFADLLFGDYLTREDKVKNVMAADTQLKTQIIVSIRSSKISSSFFCVIQPEPFAPRHCCSYISLEHQHHNYGVYNTLKSAVNLRIGSPAEYSPSAFGERMGFYNRQTTSRC